MRRIATLSALLLACCVSGCGHSQSGSQQQQQLTPAQQEGHNMEIQSWVEKSVQDVPAPPYRIGAPDKLRVIAPRVKEIDGQTAVVRTDGMIALPLVGEFSVIGKTPAEVSELITQKLKRYYSNTDLDVSVVVDEFKSRVLFVMGQVVEPGIKPFTGRDTVLTVIAKAKLNDKAWPQHVVVIRRNEDPKIKQRVTVDLKQMYMSGDLAHNYLLEEGDVVYVPPSPLANFDAQFSKLLYPLQPATAIAGYAFGF